MYNFFLQYISNVKNHNHKFGYNQTLFDLKNGTFQFHDGKKRTKNFRETKKHTFLIL